MLLVAMAFYYYTFNPLENHQFFPSCAFKSVTGLDCVGCGIQRAIHALLHGDLQAALDYNPLFVLLLPIMGYYLYYTIKRFVYGTASPNNFIYSPQFGITLIIIFVVFLILRNLPISLFSWMNSSI